MKHLIATFLFLFLADVSLAKHYVVTDVEGKVFYRSANDYRWYRVRPDIKIPANVLLQTTQGSRIVILDPKKSANSTDNTVILDQPRIVRLNKKLWRKVRRNEIYLARLPKINDEDEKETSLFNFEEAFQRTRIFFQGKSVDPVYEEKMERFKSERGALAAKIAEKIEVTFPSANTLIFSESAPHEVNIIWKQPQKDLAYNVYIWSRAAKKPASPINNQPIRGKQYFATLPRHGEFLFQVTSTNGRFLSEVIAFNVGYGALSQADISGTLSGFRFPSPDAVLSLEQSLDVIPFVWERKDPWPPGSLLTIESASPKPDIWPLSAQTGTLNIRLSAGTYIWYVANGKNLITKKFKLKIQRKRAPLVSIISNAFNDSKENRQTHFPHWRK